MMMKIAVSFKPSCCKVLVIELYSEQDVWNKYFCWCRKDFVIF